MGKRGKAISALPMTDQWLAPYYLDFRTARFGCRFGIPLA